MNNHYRQIVRQLSSIDEVERSMAQESIKAMGVAAIPYLNWVISQPHYATEALRMLVVIGDECDGDKKANIIRTMKLRAEERPLIPPEHNVIARAALEKWGIPIPQPEPSPVYHCFRCNKSSNHVEIRRCFLRSCSKMVCEDHAAIVRGGMGTWFCCEAHKKESTSHYADMM